MLGNGHGGIYNASTKDEEERSERLRGERDQIKSVRRNLGTHHAESRAEPCFKSTANDSEPEFLSTVPS